MLLVLTKVLEQFFFSFKLLQLRADYLLSDCP